MKELERTLFFIGAALVMLPTMAPASNAGEGVETNGLDAWALHWQDDFAGDTLDDTKWARCRRGTSDWNNTMSDDPRLLEVENGILHLRGMFNNGEGGDRAPYLTAGITSRGRFDFQYGKAQIRARFKSAQGAWPALWMLGARGGWPAGGEIDLMEHLNFDRKVYQTVHSGYTKHSGAATGPKSGNTAVIDRDDWNTYGCEWDADSLVFTVNGKQTFTYPRLPDAGAEQWPFDQPFYFILSMQIGGKWVNRTGPTDPDHYPAGMEIDWVRVYTRREPSREVQEGTMAGYLLVPHERVPERFNMGFSMYVAAWPLLDEYPGNRFQTGLFGTWMHAQLDGPKPIEKMYSDIEGGLGWWRDTRFATETPKFIMGGVELNFASWANGPGAGKGRDWDQPKGKYGVAQLSPWVLWPPDGLNLKQGTCGELLGYGYVPLPLTDRKDVTAGKDVPTGNHSWTLFLNAANFKGPVAFFTPYFFSHASVGDPRLAGMFLDSRPSNPNRALQMETQYVPSAQGTDDTGRVYARIAPVSFPRGPGGTSPVVNRVTAYAKEALWDAVEAWFDGGPSAGGVLDASAAVVHDFPGHGGGTWSIYGPGTRREDRVRIAWNSLAFPFAPEPDTFAYRWDSDLVTEDIAGAGSLVTLPEYYRLGEDEHGKATWLPIRREAVPAETGLLEYRFTPPPGKASEPYVTPDHPDSCWKTPGPAAGPFKALPGDGSVVTYSWYRFADQPALLNADLTDEERELIQKRVERLHRHWRRDREYLPPPTTGNLAALDPALVVTPPAGLEVGYVPIATRQEAE